MLFVHTDHAVTSFDIGDNEYKIMNAICLIVSFAIQSDMPKWFESRIMHLAKRFTIQKSVDNIGSACQKTMMLSLTD